LRDFVGCSFRFSGCFRFRRFAEMPAYLFSRREINRA